MIKEYFRNYLLHNSDVTINLKNDSLKIHNLLNEDWEITLIDTGDNTSTGGRILRIKDYIGSETFALTYGDGLCNLNINESIRSHKKWDKIATVTAVRPPGRFGALLINDSSEVETFIEKPEGKNSWINGGFFILNPIVFDYIKDDNSSWEEDCLPILIKEKELNAFKHEGFWHPMDTLRDKKQLEKIWSSGTAPWKKWL